MAPKGAEGIVATILSAARNWKVSAEKDYAAHHRGARVQTCQLSHPVERTTLCNL